jgi:CDP-diglyceride synthetase
VHPVVVLQSVILLVLANGTPVVVKKLLGNRLSRPLDSNVRFLDGRPLFGRSKTIRGVVLGVLAATIGAPLIGLGPQVGVLVGSLAMAGDLVSSFVKRRLDLPPSSRASGLDQVPESLLPLVACRDLLPLTIPDIAACVVVFSIGDLVFSRVLYAFRLRDRPY